MVIEEAIYNGIPVISSNKVGCNRDLISTLKVYTFDRTDENTKNLKKNNSKINLGEIKNKKIENSLKEFAKVYRKKND